MTALGQKLVDDLIALVGEFTRRAGDADVRFSLASRPAEARGTRIDLRITFGVGSPQSETYHDDSRTFSFVITENAITTLRQGTPEQELPDMALSEATRHALVHQMRALCEERLAARQNPWNR